MSPQKIAKSSSRTVLQNLRGVTSCGHSQQHWICLLGHPGGQTIGACPQPGILQLFCECKARRIVLANESNEIDGLRGKKIAFLSVSKIFSFAQRHF